MKATKILRHIFFYPFAFLLFLFNTHNYGQVADTGKPTPLNGKIDTSEIDTSEYIAGYPSFNLLIAAEKGYSSEVLRLLNKGADVNTRSEYGVTPLMYAAENEHLKCCKILLLNGADPNLKPDNGIPALIAAVKAGNMNIAELLIRHNADINIQDDDGITPLMYAASFNLPDIVDMLLYYEANIDLSDYDGNTALMVASYYGNQEIVDLLLQHHADVTKQDKMGFTALLSAIQNHNNEIAKILIDHGADITHKNDAGYSSLALAVLNNNTKMVNYLINKGADVNSKISFSSLPLNVAKNNKNDTLIHLLKEHNARYSIAPAFNYTSVNFDFNFGTRDFMLGGGFGFYDTRYKLSVNTGFLTRVTARYTLIPVGDNFYYQYWERRSYFFLGLTERIDLFSWNKKKAAFGIDIGGQLVDSYARYRGVKKRPGNRLFLSPKGSIYIRMQSIVYSLSYQYMDFKVHDLSPTRFNLGINLLIPGKIVRLSTKKVLWYL